MYERTRKPFSSQDYIGNNFLAYQYLKRDFAQQTNLAGEYYYPQLRKEDYGIDVAIYANQEDAEQNMEPLAFLELEIKDRRCCNWQKGTFPWSDVHALYRKGTSNFQACVPFWICYNEAGSDCITLNMESFLDYPIAQNKSIYHDSVYTIPKEIITFGCEKIVRAMDEFVMGQMGITEDEFIADWKNYYRRTNLAFRNRHHYEKAKEIQPQYRRRSQMNQLLPGIASFL